MRFERGDVILRYGFRDDGDFDFWAKGAWFRFDNETGGELNEECGFTDKSNCMFQVVKYGARDWWIRVKTIGNRVGWVLTGRRRAGTYSVSRAAGSELHALLLSGIPMIASS